MLASVLAIFQVYESLMMMMRRRRRRGRGGRGGGLVDEINIHVHVENVGKPIDVVFRRTKNINGLDSIMTYVDRANGRFYYTCRFIIP